MRRLSFCLLAGLALASLPSPVPAQTASLVRDLGHQGFPDSYDFRAPQAVATVQGKVFSVSASEGEMWVSDGTAQGTLMLRPGCDGLCSSEPHILGSLSNVLLWTAQTELGFQLWRSNGTRAGTYSLSETPLAYHYEDSHPAPSAALGGTAIYFALDNGTGHALWRSDGTRAGTRLVRDFGTGKIGDLRADSSRVFLSVFQGSDTWSIWTSDGTAAGTKEVKSLGRFFPSQLTAVEGHLFFFAQSDGFELWTSDGTAAGTLAVTQLSPTNPFGDRQPYLDEHLLSVAGRRVYFIADDVLHGQELWVSDGTAAGTRRATDFGTAEPRFAFFAEVGGRALFFADDDLGHNGLWTTGGTPESTEYLPWPCEGCQSGQIEFIAEIGGRVVLKVYSWVLSTDGTAAGTRVLRAACEECDPVFPQNARDLGASGIVWFADRQDLWRTDGTQAGTRRAAVFPAEGQVDRSSFFIAPSPQPTLFVPHRGRPALWSLTAGGLRLVAASAPNGANGTAYNLAALRGHLSFTACPDERSQLWQSTGTEAGTVPVFELEQSSFSSCSARFDSPVSTGSLLFYIGDGATDFTKALWRTDGTPGGTLKLTSDLDFEEPLVLAGGRVVFRATRDDQATLWSSDGTPAGTMELASWPRIGNSVSSLTSTGSDAYFYLASFNADRGVWTSDGTQQGTHKVIDPGSGPGSAYGFTRVGSNVFFLFDGIWKTNGTAAGTTHLEAVAGLDARSNPSDLAAFQGKLYFILPSSTGERRAFWSTDGTAAGTILLADFATGRFFSTPTSLRTAGGRLFFVMNDGVHGTELWTSDGTAAGTRLVRDIRPGALSSRPDNLTAAGGRLYFVAGEDLHGLELWRSDGTEAGTRLVQDIAPLGRSSFPDLLTEAGDRLYFRADDGVTGRELWSLPLIGDGGPGGCQPSPTHLCLNGGRYQVEAAWRIAAPFSGTVREGRGTAVPLTADTGTFWFFEPTNVEAIVKVLDGRTLNDHVWVFYGALSDVQYTLTVTDTQTGLTRRYSNPQGQLASVGDTTGFGPLGAFSTHPIPPVATAAASSPPPLLSIQKGRAALPPCQPGARRLCLNDNRFTVEVAWKDFQSHTGKGTTVPLTTDTGAFWFFNPDNIELMVKVLDGRPFNNHFWLFYGALSNVEYTLTVTDTQTGTMRTYKNPSGQFASVADTDAF